MARLPIGPWRPDTAVLDSAVLADVRNAVWETRGWAPERSLQPIIDAQLADPIQGLFTARRTDGSLELYAAAAGKILRLPSKNGAAQDIGKVAGYSSNPLTRWRTVQFGNAIFATNFDDPIQTYDLKLGGAFADLAGSPPQAKYIAVVRELISVAYTSDDVDGEDPYRVQWHGYTAGLPDPTVWGTDPQTQADFQRLPDYGQITGLTGGEFGTVICENGVFRYTYVGSPLIYQFDAVERRLGCRVPQSVVQYRQVTYWYSPSGFMAFDGSSARPIGLGKVDDFFADDFDEDQMALMSATPDLARQQVRWLYAGKGNDGTKANRLITYSTDLDEWSVMDVDAQLIAPGRTYGLDLDDVTTFGDLDADPQINLDDPSLWSSLPQTLAVSGGRVSSFSGAVLPAEFELAERSFDPDGGLRGIYRRAAIQAQGGTQSLTVGRRERWNGDVSWSNPYPIQADGYLRFRELGRSHKFRVALSGDWRTARSIDLYGNPLGQR